jgi:hypothetical protein
MDTHGSQEFLWASDVPQEPQSRQDQPGYTRFLMSSCVLQVTLKSHNLDRTNLDTGGYHVFLCASGVSEEP